MKTVCASILLLLALNYLAYSVILLIFDVSKQNTFNDFNTQAKFNLWVKSMKCFDFGPTIVNMTCKVKPIRNKCSLIDMRALTTRAPNVTGRFRIFFKFTGGFRPYIFDFTFDVCELMAKNSPVLSNKAGKIVVDTVKEVYESLFTGCPYEGQYNSAPWFDLNKTLSPFLPPIVPSGVFRVLFEFFSAPNQSLLAIQADVLVKATKEYRDTDFSFLNMG